MSCEGEQDMQYSSESKQDPLLIHPMEERLVESHKQQKKRLIILFPIPLQGHITPMLQLANILYSKGFSITIIHTNFNSPNPSNYQHFTFHSIHQGLPESQISEWFSNDLTAPLIHLNVTCVKPFQDALAKFMLLEGGHNESIACLITDAVWYFTQQVADGFGIPRIVLRTSNVSNFIVYDALPLLRDRGYLPIKDTQLEEPISEIPPLKVKDLPIIEKIRNPEDFFYLVSSTLAAVKASSGLIWNSCQHLEPDALSKCHQVFPGVPIFPIGPFHKYFRALSGSSLLDQDQSSITWLDTQEPNSVLYVSFGSIAAIKESQFTEIALGLVNSKQPFLWVVRPGLVDGSDWLGPLPDGLHQLLNERGRIVKWAPQQEVLSHPATGGFWTHCGWNSVLESVCEGVPMICHPSFADQKTNARYVSDVWKIGIHLENKLESGEIERAIKTLMVEKEGKEMRERALSFKGKIDLCLAQGGSSYESLDGLISCILSL